jgi:hypothetical protein
MFRLRPFWCWVLTGHCWDKTRSTHKAARMVNRCLICDTYTTGPD